MLDELQWKLKSSYNSIIDDVANDFYILALSESITYKRVSGYFSCKALSIYAEGLDRLAENNGYIQFIISQSISEKDYAEIKNGYFERSMKENLTLRDKKRLGNLAYLISQGKADVKFGLVKNGLFHTKWGIFEDKKENIIYFNGSMNETANGIENNYDSFDVDVSWDISNNIRRRISQKKEEFYLLWNNKYPGVEIIDANETVYQLIEEYDVGKIQKITSNLDGSLILDMDEKYLFFIDNTIEGITSKKTFKSKFTFYLDEEKGYPHFKKSLSYKDIEEIIEKAKKQANKQNINFHVTPKVKEFIENQRYSIEEYRKAGLTLKNQDIRWNNEYKEFKSILDLEIERPLKPIQMQSALYMLIQKRAANFSVPGSGKTAMVLGVFAYLNSIKKGRPIKRLLVVCPLNAFMSWREEFEKVFGKNKDIKELNIHDRTINGSKLVFEAQWPASNLVLINYESLNKFQDSILKCLSYDTETMIVYDEVHRVKGIQAKRAISALEIADKVEYRYVLTGTPIPNSYLDIYNFLHILFNKEYYTYFGFEQNMLKNPNPREIEEINEKLAPYYWRTSKEDLGVPPAESDRFIEVSPSKEQQRLAEIIYANAQNPLVVWIRMIQLSTNPELVNQKINYSELGYSEDEDLENNLYDQISEESRKELESSIKDSEIEDIREWDLSEIKSPKFDKGIELVTKIVKQQGKVVVWGLFVNTLQKITKVLKEQGINAELIYGGTTKDDRDDLIKTFKKETSDIQVLVSNPNTLGESVSLHNVAHDAVYFEYNYNLTFMLQSRDRIHRLGLDRNQKTRYYYLMTVTDLEIYNFIDRKIYDRLEEKKIRMNAAIDGNFLIPEFTDSEIDEMKEIIESERRYK